jgi:GNAT superfamily N-acetyltransferase
MSNELPITLRPANSEDVGFIFNAWLKSFRNSDLSKDIANEVYYSEHHKVIENLLKTYEVLIACNQDDLTQIYGFICAGSTDNIFTVNYIYVKHTFRRMGIGLALLNAFEHNDEYAAIYTHKTRCAPAIAKKFNFIYHPYVALAPQLYAQKDD